jgi:alpha-D-ribose 1-methylphosphonate 5-triphosphate diphosphatase PhnM
MATRRAGQALGLEGVGSLAEGGTGDAIIVQVRGEVPVVTTTIVGGVPVYDVTYRLPVARRRRQAQSAS